jgi:hypothetical protein
MKSIPKPLIGMAVLVVTIVLSPLIVGHIVFSALWGEFKGNSGRKRLSDKKAKPATAMRHGMRVPAHLPGGSLHYAE